MKKPVKKTTKKDKFTWDEGDVTITLSKERKRALRKIEMEKANKLPPSAFKINR